MDTEIGKLKNTTLNPPIRFMLLERLWLFLTLLLSLLAGPARASDTPELLVLVSQRNAETIAEAVSLFHHRRRRRRQSGPPGRRI